MRKTLFLLTLLTSFVMADEKELFGKLDLIQHYTETLLMDMETNADRFPRVMHERDYYYLLGRLHTVIEIKEIAKCSLYEECAK